MPNIGLVLTLAAAVVCMPVHAAETAAPACPAHAAPLPAPWTAWAKPQPAKSFDTATPSGFLSLDTAYDVTLFPIDKVSFALQPGKPIPLDRFGGVFALAVPHAAKVGIALSDGAWIDVINGDTAEATLEHGHGPDCSGIRKIVWFDLKDGIYRIQIEGAPKGSIRFMAVVK